MKLKVKKEGIFKTHWNWKAIETNYIINVLEK